MGQTARRPQANENRPIEFDEQSADAEFRAAEALQRAMRVDPVTQLPNRRQFVEDFGFGLPSTPRGEGDVLVMFTLAEADQFNSILRALGHGFSEEFVRLGADRLRRILPDDIPLYHISLLSFAFPLQVFSTDTQPAQIDDIMRAFEGPLACAGIPIRNRIGVGLTMLEGHSTEPSEMLRGALVAAQDSRTTAEGWAWYDRKSDQEHLRSFRLLADLGRLIERPDAMDDDQLSLHFQPRINLGNGDCVGAEALMRWEHPSLGSISPEEFIGLAETTALITPLTRWVISNGIARSAAWRDAGIGAKVSMNVAPTNLTEKDFADFVLETCDTHQLDPRAIEIEFTESSCAGDDAITVKQLTELREAGVTVAIDDFGAGYSNMRYLRSIPADVLKIDQNFILDLDECPKNEKIVPTIINLGHRLGFDVVAEGIESRQSYDKLSRWGCDEGQGYFMSKPLSEPDFVEWYGARIRNVA